MILSVVISGVIAPVGLAWIKGDGWLQRMGFKDSTGAAVVYMCGGVCGLVGNLMLGPRFSIFSKQFTDIKKNTYQEVYRKMERRQRKEEDNLLSRMESQISLPQVSLRVANNFRNSQTSTQDNYENTTR